MKFAAKTVEEVLWIANDHIVCYILLPMIVQYWTHFYQLSRYLIELVQSSSVEHRVVIALWNPLAPEHVSQSMKNEIDGYNTRNNAPKPKSDN